MEKKYFLLTPVSLLWKYYSRPFQRNSKVYLLYHKPSKSACLTMFSTVRRNQTSELFGHVVISQATQVCYFPIFKQLLFILSLFCQFAQRALVDYAVPIPYAAYIFIYSRLPWIWIIFQINFNLSIIFSFITTSSLIFRAVGLLASLELRTQRPLCKTNSSES